MSQILNRLNRLQNRTDHLDAAALFSKHDASWSESTRRTYRTDVRLFNEWLQNQNEDLEPRSLGAYFESVKQQLHHSTLKRKKSVLLRTFKAQFPGDIEAQRHSKQAIEDALALP